MDINWIVNLYARGVVLPLAQPSIPQEVHKIREKYKRKKPETGIEEDYE